MNQTIGIPGEKLIKVSQQIEKLHKQAACCSNATVREIQKLAGLLQFLCKAVLYSRKTLPALHLWQDTISRSEPTSPLACEIVSGIQKRPWYVESFSLRYSSSTTAHCSLLDHHQLWSTRCWSLHRHSGIESGLQHSVWNRMASGPLGNIQPPNKPPHQCTGTFHSSASCHHLEGQTSREAHLAPLWQYSHHYNGEQKVIQGSHLYESALSINTFMFALSDIYLTAMHILGKENITADLLSCFKVSKFLSTYPHMSKVAVLPMNSQWTPCQNFSTRSS